MPGVWRRCSADRVQTALRLRNHPWHSHSWQPPVAADFLSANLRPIRKILTHLGEPLRFPPVSPARGPPTDWGELILRLLAAATRAFGPSRFQGPSAVRVVEQLLKTRRMLGEALREPGGVDEAEGNQVLEMHLIFAAK